MSTTMATSDSLSAARFNTKSPRYFWSTPDPAAPLAAPRPSARVKRQRSLLAWPAWGLTATTWFCVGMFWPGH